MQDNDIDAAYSRSTQVEVCRALVDSSVIRVRGGLSDSSAASLWRTVETEFQRSPELVALDVSAVTEIDAAGVAVLLAAADRAGESDIAFCLVGAREGTVGAALARADLTELFEMIPTSTAPDGNPSH